MATKFVVWEHMPAGASGAECPWIVDTLDEAKVGIAAAAEEWGNEFPDWRVEVSEDGTRADAYDDTMEYSHRMTAYIETHEAADIADLIEYVESY